MRKNLYLILAAMFPVLLMGTAAYSQSAYFQAMTSLNPVLYLPLQETNQPPIGDVETNLGSLGPSANAVYSSGVGVTKAQGGVTGDGDTCIFDTDAAGGFLAVSTLDPHTAVTNGTLTVEVWVNSAEQGRNFEGILSKSGGNSGGIGGANNQGGWCLSQNYIAYLDTANFRGFDFHVYNGKGHEGAEVIVPFNVVNSQWYHIVATFDGANCVLYVNGTNEVAAGDGMQIPMIGSYVPDTWQPLEIGSSRNLNGNNYHGNIDEVAIYTNVLTAGQVQTHYAAVSGTGYAATILADKPYMYWRMDSPGYTAPDPGTYPIATNYGTLPNSFFGLYGTAAQPGIPGPQFSGMKDPNNGNASYGVAINGVSGNNGGIANVPVGYAAGVGTFEAAPDAAPIIVTNIFTDPNHLLLNPTNYTSSTNISRTPFSCSIWFQGRPHDWNRFQTIFGHTDDGWRCAMNGSGRIQWNPGPGGEVQTTYIYDDQQWHQFVGTYDGTNVLTYVDGRLDVSTTTSGSGNGSETFPMVGGDPQYLNGGNANYPLGDIGRANANGAYAVRCFSGNVAHFAFFNYVVSAAQIANLYSNAVPNQAPYILAQPVTGRVNPGEAFLFFGIVANGTPSLGYQWYYNSTSNYLGATKLVNDGVKYALVNTSQMTVSNLVNGDSGYYFCVVTNNSGSVTSILATLQVNYGPIITAQNPTSNFVLFPNQKASLSVTAIAATNSPLSYQWYVNGVGDPNGTNAVYVSSGVTTAGTSFYCIVTNQYGSAISATVTASAILPVPASVTNTPFGKNLLALNPTAYWPLHDVEASVQGDTETNYGSIGSVANGGYADWRLEMAAAIGQNFGNAENATNNVYVLHGIRGAIAGDPDTAVHFAGGNGGQNVDFVVVPQTSPKLTIKPPFTLEAWVRPDNNPSFMVILSEDSGDSLNGNGNRGGFNWLYSGGTPNCFSMTVYNGTGGNSTEPKTTASYPPGAWYHLVTTFDGANVTYYINGVQDPLINSPAATMNPNTWDPITIGCGRGYANNLWQGSIDEVAVYPSLLPLSEIQKHYNDGTNAAYANYKGDVLADNPALYYRMDASKYVPPALNTWPVATNYGNVAINGVYTPGSVPSGGPGPSVNGVPVAGLPNSALVTDGNSSFVDALNVPAFHPTGKTPFTVAAWMKANPDDAGARNWISVVAEGDASWRLNMNGGNGRANFNSQNSGDLGNSAASLTINDGQWHYVVGSCDGSNTTLYVDGLVSATNFNANLNNASPNVELFLGAYPNNNVYNGNSWASILNEGAGGGSFGNDNSRILAGSICEAAFWNGTALTPSQVTTLYNAAGVGPEILRQPISSSASANGGFTNSILAVGSGTLSYQWYKNGQPMPVNGQTNFPPGFGPTNTTLILYPVSTNDQSVDYYVVITNSIGSVTSAVWALNPVFFSAPIFTNNILNTSLTVYAGGHASYSVFAVGTVPISYQWYSNNVPVPGATGTTYSPSGIQAAGQTDTFYCVASNSIGTTTSSVASVKVIAIPSVIPYSDVVMADNPFGFWPMDETNLAIIAFDYAAGNDGIYTNALQGQPGFNSIDTNRTSVEFSTTTLQNSDIYGVPTNVNFSAPNGSNSNFSVECWAKGNFSQGEDAGVVTKGYGGGGEQFNLDCGSDGISAANPVAHSYRFFVRDAGGTVHAINSTVNPGDDLWHHLVAVCNETNGWVILYVDGQPVGSNAISPGSGILSSTYNMTIGARPSNATTNVNDLQYVGWIQDVAVYNYALSAQQVLNHFNAADIPASVFIQPTNVTVGEFGTAVFTEESIGTPPLAYQWFTNSVAVGNGTNATLVLPNVPFAENNLQVYMQVANNFGTNFSGVPPQTPVSLTVIQGLPQIFGEPPAVVFIEGGQMASIPVTVYGTEPLSYQWQVSDTNAVNWTNLTDNGGITGSLSNILTIAQARSADAGSYQLIIANSYGSVTSSIADVVVGSLPVNFNGSGLGWTTNQEAGPFSGTPPFIANNLLALTDGPGNEGRSFFFQYPQYIGAWQASFIYQVSPGGAPGANEADGITFCLQNDSRGPAALGGGGGSLGYSGITPSWSLQFNIYPSYNNAGSPNSGYGFQQNGVITPTPYATPVSGSSYVNVGSGDPINVSLTYLNGTVSMVLTDAVAGVSFATNTAVNLPNVLGGNTAYVGFTGADGGSAATQTITNFTFISFVSESINLTATNTVVVTWPGAISGYALLQNHNLITTNWVPVTNADNVVNGLNQVIIPVANTNTFYRLGLLH